MDPLTLSGIASVLLKAGPGLIRSVGRWFGGSTSAAADSVAGMVESVRESLPVAEYTRGAQPLVNNDKPSQGKDKPVQTLTDAELAMCRSMGITGEEFLAAKPKQENN